MPVITFRNKEINYRKEGTGNPVILLHGFGEYGHIWDQQIDRLKKNNLLIIPDLPGSGASERLDGDCTLEDYAEVVKSISEKENLNVGHKQFTLIGHSMGGYITLVFAKKYPELLSAFGLFHSSAFADSEEKIKVREKNIEFIRKNGGNLFSETTIPNLFAQKTRDEHPELVNNLVALAQKISDEALIQYTRAMINRVDTTSVLESFPRPVLFIIGVHDTAVPLDASLKQCHLTAISTIHILKNSGHIGMWEQPGLSTQYLEEFISSNSSVKI